MRAYKFGLLMLLQMGIVVPRSVNATPIIDQAFQTIDRMNGWGGIMNSQNCVAQTFTVGQAGTFSGVQLFLEKSTWSKVWLEAPLVVDIRETIDGVPLDDESDILASVVLQPQKISSYLHPWWVSVDFSPWGIEVESGESLAIVLRMTSGPTTQNSYNYFGFAGLGWDPYTHDRPIGDDPIPDPYTGGRVYWQNLNDGLWVSPQPWDIFFRTYIGEFAPPDPEPNPNPPVPEPSTLLLLGSGLLGLVGFRWKFKK